MSDLITADLVDLDLPAGDRRTVVRPLAERLARAGRVTDLVFLIAAPEGGGSDHMTVLAALARRLVRKSFTGRAPLTSRSATRTASRTCRRSRSG